MTVLATSPASSPRASGPSLYKLVAGLPAEQRLRQPADALVIIGRQLELVVQDQGLAADVALGTLRFSLFRLHQGRIAQLAPLCRSVTVYGEADVEPPAMPGVEFVALPPGSPLSQEWFVLVDSPYFWGGLITQAVPERAAGNMRRYLFDGALTADERVVSRAGLLLSLARRRPASDVGPRHPLANRAHWALVAYNLASHGEAERLNLAQSLAELPELYEVAALRDRPLEELLPGALDALQRHAGAVGQLIYRCDGASLTPLFWGGVNRPQPLPAQSGLVGRALAENAPILAPLSGADPEAAVLAEAHSAVAVPLLVADRPWGVLLVGQAEPDPNDSPTAAGVIGVAALLEQILAARGIAAQQAAQPAPVAPVRLGLQGVDPSSGAQAQPGQPGYGAQGAPPQSGQTGYGAQGVPPLPGAQAQPGYGAQGVPPLPGAQAQPGYGAQGVPPLPGAQAQPGYGAQGVPPLPGAQAQPGQAGYGAQPGFGAQFGQAGYSAQSAATSPGAQPGQAAYGAQPGFGVQGAEPSSGMQPPLAAAPQPVQPAEAVQPASPQPGQPAQPIVGPAAGAFGLPSWMRGAAPPPGARTLPAAPTTLAAPQASSLPAPQDGAGDRSFPALQKRLMGALVAFDQRSADQVWAEACSLYSTETICTELLMPVQIAVGEGWHRGEVSVAAEHFSSRFVEGKLITMLTAHSDNFTGPLAVIGCAQGELHELGAIMLSLFMRWAGFRVIYLGQNVPNSTIEETIRQLRPQILGLSATTIEGAHHLTEVGHIVTRLEPPRPTFIFGGAAFYERPDLRGRIAGQFLEGDVRKIVRDLAAQFQQ